jgi:LPXTG-site transpeptidase (sortase) family protein
MISRVLSVIGALLVLCGVALLGYVGYTYAHQRSASTPHWTPSQQRQGQQIALKLTHQQQAPSPAAGAGSEPPTRMVIPRIGVNSPVAQTAPVGGVWNVVDWEVGHLSTTPNPGGAGNGAYSGHDDIKGEVFKRLGELHPGDSILLYTRDRVYTYVVTRQLAVDPSDVSVLAPTARPTISLISCTPYWVDTQRLVVQAALKSSRAA